MAKFTVEFTRILFFEQEFEAYNEDAAKELALEYANDLNGIPSEDWTTANDSVRAWQS
jgi:hypothetical protein